MRSGTRKALRKHAMEEKKRSRKEFVVTYRERELLFTIAALVPYLDDLAPGDSQETWEMERRANGTISVRYEFSDLDHALGIVCEVDIDRSAKDAKVSCAARAGIFRTECNEGPKKRVEEQNDFFRWGDQSYYAEVMLNGKPSGFGFFGRSGRKRYALTVIGVLFEDAEAMAEAVGPALDKLLAYEP